MLGFYGSNVERKLELGQGCYLVLPLSFWDFWRIKDSPLTDITS